MNTANHDDRETRALNALILAAIRNRKDENVTFEDLEEDERFLSEEDLAALERLGPDLGSRIVAGNPVDIPREQVKETEAELATAMNRAGEDCDLTDAARDEIERRIREVDEQEGDEARDEDSG